MTRLDEAIAAELTFATWVDTLDEIVDADAFCVRYSAVDRALDDLLHRDAGVCETFGVEYMHGRDAMRTTHAAVQRLNQRTIRAQLDRQLEMDRIAHVALIARVCAATGTTNLLSGGSQ